MTVFTRDSLISYLLDHQKRYPEKGDYAVEVRDHLLVEPPRNLEHDDKDRVLVLVGIGYR